MRNTNWISEPAYRRKGYAHAALRLLLLYACAPPLSVNPQTLVARIGAKNEASIALFKKLGFEKTKYVEVFDEVEMRYNKDQGLLEYSSVTGLQPKLDARVFD